MPWQTVWRDPELFIEHKGVRVYHAYRNDDFDQKLKYWYVVYTNDDFDGQCVEFDVRDLPVPDSAAPGEANHEEIIRHAIDYGYITKSGVVKGILAFGQLVRCLKEEVS